MTAELGTIATRIPARLDRLPWSRFHWKVVAGLGTVWILDGLEVTMVGSVAARLTEKGSGIDMTPASIGVAAAAYVAGACLGALFFGQLTDRFGRKKLFILTLGVYIAATVATAFSFNPLYFYIARFVTGAGIGGEYAAINSAIDELIPARARGRVDLVINGSYWMGAAGGSALALLFLNESIFPGNIGWRCGFGFGALLGLTILLVRRHVPESPRWLFIHGREQDAERIVDDIEREITDETGTSLSVPDGILKIRQRKAIPFRMIAKTAFKLYPRRAVLGLALFVGQAFLYNAFTFNLGGLLGTFYDVGSSIVPLFLILWALGNFAGPVLLGRLFDTVGRKPMISLCYLGSALVSVPLIIVFLTGGVSGWGFLGILIAVFFLASAGASSAYLTVSEIFPMETRALAIAFFYAVGTAIGGITGPLLFGQMIGSGDRGFMAIGLIIGAAAMALGGVAELTLGVRAERANLEDIATPLTAEEGEAGEGERPAAETSEEHRAARRCREEAERSRARAAEHRAAFLELHVRADAGDTEAADRARTEEALADVDDLGARALDEWAVAHEERAAAERADDEHRATAARLRAQAAEQRARVWERRRQARTDESEREQARDTALAEAAAERARADEQRAAAEQDRADAAEPDGTPSGVYRARIDVHEAWAAVHDARARVHEARAERGGGDARDEERDASAAEQRAVAAEQRLVAAEHYASADAVHGELQDAEESEARQAEAAARRREAQEVEQRVRERIARRQERERTGLRRLRPGPGGWLHTARTGGFDPQAAAVAEESLDREIESIARALDERGRADREELARLVGARYWGPGRFGAALRAAVEEGRVRRLSARSFGAPEQNADD